MKISEIFYSLQGEGVYAGIPMAFLRFQGCPFRCRWCDTQYTWDFEGGADVSLDEALEAIARWPSKMVCITGGEPLAHLPDLRTVVSALNERGYWTEVETAGGYRLPLELPVDCWVMDIKCPGSEMEHINKYGEVARLRPQDQLKFVTADRGDFDFALGVLQQYKPECPVLFSPVWGDLDPAVLAEWIKNEAPEARLSLQIHKVLWEPGRRGV